MLDQRLIDARLQVYVLSTITICYSGRVRNRLWSHTLQVRLEAEYQAMAQRKCELLWLWSILSELGFVETISSQLYCDKKSGIMLSLDLVLHEWTKHIELVHFIRGKVRVGHVTPFISSFEQTAYMFTKSMGPSLLQSFIVKLGLVDIFESA